VKLLYSNTSPFARKCRVVAIEVGISDRVENLMTIPVDPASGIDKANPLNKIPALIQDDGAAIYDSPVICEFLDQLGNGGLFPPPGEARWQALRRQALGDGMMDAAILRRSEAMRPESQRSAEWDKRQKTKITQGLDALESDGLPTSLDIGTITVAITLDYLDFRFKAENWRDGHPRLAQWHQGFSRRPSLQSTMPKD
jgi:glutathione S-transferase